MKKVILIVGMPGSGKSYAADAMRNKFGAKVIHSGDIIREEVEREGLKYSPTADAAIAHWFHSYGREALIVQKVFEMIQKSKKELIVVEGFRNLDEVQILQDLLNHKVSVVAIKSSFKTRYRRELARGRFGKQETTEYIKNRDISEKHHGIVRLITKAKYKIDNNGSKSDLERKVFRLINRLLKQ